MIEALSKIKTMAELLNLSPSDLSLAGSISLMMICKECCLCELLTVKVTRGVILRTEESAAYFADFDWPIRNLQRPCKLHP
jgi:hypothetical protein